jgi:hypothetical protein
MITISVIVVVLVITTAIIIIIITIMMMIAITSIIITSTCTQEVVIPPPPVGYEILQRYADWRAKHGHAQDYIGAAARCLEHGDAAEH